MFTRFQERLRLHQRLVLVVLLFAVPFSTLALWLLARGINVHINFATQELRGDTVQRPLNRLLFTAGRWHLQATGDTTQDPAALRQAMAEGFRELDRALATHG